MSDTTTPTGRPDLTHGQVTDPGASDLQTGDFGLDGDLRKVMTEALEQAWNKDDPGATELPDDAPPASSPDDSADTAATPAPASPSTPDAPASDVEDGAGGGGDDADQGAAPDAATPSAPGTAPGDDEFSIDQYAQEYFGTQLTKDQARELFGLLGGLQSMDANQRAQLDAILSGGQALQYPATQGQAPQQYPVTAGQLPAPDDPAVATLGPRPDDEYLAAQWDLTATAVRAQSQQLAQIQQDIARTTQHQLEAQQRDYETRISTVSSQWREQHPILTDGEYDALTDRIARSGTFPALIQAHGSVEAATNAALEQFFWADPALRSRAIANAASGRQVGDATQVDPNSPVAQQQAQIEANRQARAAAVAGGGGQQPPRTGAAPKTADERKKAMVAELAEHGDFA